MKRNRPSKALNLSTSRWLAYAAAGAATSLGGAQSAEAEIHYSGLINAKFNNAYQEGGTRNFPLRHSARIHFSKNFYQRNFLIDGAAVSNRFCGYQTAPGGSFYVSRLAQGDVISNCAFVSSDRKGVLFQSSGGTGQFFEPGIGFIPFRFNNGAGMQYGWARIKRLHTNDSFLLVDYAWGDPGDRIKAGQTRSAGDQVEAVPDQGSLGMLALGGAGLMAWRRRRAGTRGPADR